MRVFVSDHIKGVQRSLKSSFFFGDLQMFISRSHFQNTSLLSVCLVPWRLQAA